jgi:ABC-2 type transport system permease protein
MEEKPMGKYGTVFLFSVRQSLKDYKGLIGLNLFLVTCLVVFAHLWKVAAAKMGAMHLNQDELLWYIALNEWVLISLPSIEDNIEQDLRNGKLASQLPRPISYLGMTFCEGLGTLVVNLLFLGCTTFAFTWWRVGSLPCSEWGVLLFVGLGLCSAVVGLLFQMAVGLTAFWLQEVRPFSWIWEKCLFALGGLILPLAVYPNWIQKIAAWTPFPVVLGQRSALAIDFGFMPVLQLLIPLFVWIGVGVGILIILYQRGLRQINLEGG